MTQEERNAHMYAVNQAAELRAEVKRLQAELTETKEICSELRRFDVAEIERLKADKAGWEVEGFISRLTQRDDTNSERLVLEAVSYLRVFSLDCDALRAEVQRLKAEYEIAFNVGYEEAKEGYIAEVERWKAEVERLLKQVADLAFAAADRTDEIALLHAGIRDAVEALDRNSTSAPVLEALRALVSKS